MPSTVKVLNSNLYCYSGYSDFYNDLLGKLKCQVISTYITVNNVHTVIEGFRDDKYQNIINSSVAIPDGKPLEIVGRLKGNKTIKRLFGPTLMEAVLNNGQWDELKHFFIGTSIENLEHLKKSILLKFPLAKIVGMIAPPYGLFEQWDNASYINEINESRADIIWVGLGAPKQEKWMFQFQPAINKGVLIGIGAGFNYITGEIRHAPQWMKNSSLEWLFRLVQEPKRLWKRYITVIPPFLIYATWDIIVFHVSKLNNKVK